MGALLSLECRVEGDRAGGEVDPPHELDGLGRAVLAVHTRVLPLDRERALVADPVERPHDRLELHVAVPGRDEVPAPAAVAEVEVRVEDRAVAVEIDLRVLYMDVEDPVRERVEELGRVDELPDQVARVEVESE